MASPLPRLIPQSQKTGLFAATALLLLLAVASVVIYYQRRQPPIKTIDYTQLSNLSRSPEVASLQIDGEAMTVTNKDGSLAQAIVPDSAAQKEITEGFVKNNLPVQYQS